MSAARRRLAFLLVVLVAVTLDVVAGVVAHQHTRPALDDFAVLRGVNVYTLENARTLPVDEVHGEPASSYRYLADRGLRLIRLAVPWQQLQPVGADGDLAAALARPLDASYLAIVEREIAAIEDAGMFPVLDLHNGCGFPQGPGTKPANQVYCGDGLSTAQAVQIWQKLSDVFRDDHRIAAYDLFNEPTVGQVAPDTYRAVTRAVVGALRERGDHHVLWVEAMKGTSMSALAPDGPWIDDPEHRTEYSAHFYPAFKADEFSAAQSATFLDAIDAFGTWCARGDVRCSIGEVGWPGDQADPTPGTTTAEWNRLGEQAYRLADRYGMDVTYFGAASNSISTLWAYGAPRPAAGRAGPEPADPVGVSTSFSAATVVEAHPSTRRP